MVETLKSTDNDGLAGIFSKEVTGINSTKKMLSRNRTSCLWE